MRTDENTSLRYTQRSVIAVWGLSGAGKSTFLRRIFALTGTEKKPVITDDGVVVLDSEQARLQWRKVPRRVTQLLHFSRILRHLCGPRPVVFHARGTQRLLTYILRGITRLCGKHWNVIALEISPHDAVQGQQKRGRITPARIFNRQVRAWKRNATLREGPHTRVLQRREADRIQRITIEP